VFATSPGEDPGKFPAYGADAVRWGLLAMSSGQDVRFNEEKIAQAQQLTNKLWNASRLILLRVGAEARPDAEPLTVEDRWILSRLQHAAITIGDAIDRFEFSRPALALYDFIFSELCDWYLELVKPRLYEGDAQTQAFLVHLLTETVTLAHPLLPFVTEEIFSHIPGSSGLLAARVAAASAGIADRSAEAELARAIEAIQAVRAWRDAAEVKPSAVLPARVRADGYDATLDQVVRLGRLSLADANGSAGGGAAIAIPGGAIEILQSDNVDLEAASRKRTARQAELEAEIARAEGRLGNAGFVAKAPPAVVEAERAKLESLRAELEAL
jgi:valyl-tRNA synthetase